MIIIGLAGSKGTGKSTVAKYLEENHGFTRMSFADPIRDMLCHLGVTRREMNFEKETPLPRFNGKTPRQMMQTLGTEWGRGMVDQDIWTAHMGRRLTAIMALDNGRYEALVVIDDVRFDDEAAMIERMGGETFLLRRRGVVDRGRDMHASERGLRLTPKVLLKELPNLPTNPKHDCDLRRFVREIILKEKQ